jgi:hypothetical protein
MTPELANCLKCLLAVLAYWWLMYAEWLLMKPVRDEKRRKRGEG